MPNPNARTILTPKSIVALRPQPGKRVHAFDAIVPGLAVRVTEKGAKSFCLITRFGGEQKWITLGPVVLDAKGRVANLAEARTDANELISKVKRGEKVSRGQVIARVGSTGNVSEPQLHFELRRGNHPVDPREFLSPLPTAATKDSRTG